MIDRGKHSLLGVRIDAVDYEAATTRIVAASEGGEPYGVSALAVHGVVEAARDPELRYRVNRLDLVTPDGQAVRWALDLLHDTELPDRCYGPTLMLEVCRAATERGLPIYLHGSRADVLSALTRNLSTFVPGLEVAGTSPSAFGRVSPDELDTLAGRIQASGARLVFAGLGCPRQEVFAYEMRERAGMPVLAVGAAFDYHAGLLSEPPRWVQRSGLQWAWRLASEPGRLWRRYLSTNPAFVAGVAAQRLGRPRTIAVERTPRFEGWA